MIMFCKSTTFLSTKTNVYLNDIIRYCRTAPFIQSSTKITFIFQQTKNNNTNKTKQKNQKTTKNYTKKKKNKKKQNKTTTPSPSPTVQNNSQI